MMRSTSGPELHARGVTRFLRSRLYPILTNQIAICYIYYSK